jgi:hypothetical protein
LKKVRDRVRSLFGIECKDDDAVIGVQFYH